MCYRTQWPVAISNETPCHKISWNFENRRNKERHILNDPIALRFITLDSNNTTEIPANVHNGFTDIRINDFVWCGETMASLQMKKPLWYTLAAFLSGLKVWHMKSDGEHVHLMEGAIMRKVTFLSNHLQVNGAHGGFSWSYLRTIIVVMQWLVKDGRMPRGSLQICPPGNSPFIAHPNMRFLGSYSMSCGWKIKGIIMLANWHWLQYHTNQDQYLHKSMHNFTWEIKYFIAYLFYALYVPCNQIQMFQKVTRCF